MISFSILEGHYLLLLIPYSKFLFLLLPATKQPRGKSTRLALQA